MTPNAWDSIGSDGEQRALDRVLAGHNGRTARRRWRASEATGAPGCGILAVVFLSLSLGTRALPRRAAHALRSQPGNPNRTTSARRAR
jgi:hypothetical protein